MPLQVISFFLYFSLILTLYLLDCILSHSKHDLNYNKVIIWLHGLDDSPYPWASLLSSLISEIFQPDIDSDNNLSYMSSKLRVKVILPSASYIEITVNNGLKMSGK